MVLDRTANGSMRSLHFIGLYNVSSDFGSLHIQIKSINLAGFKQVNPIYDLTRCASQEYKVRYSWTSLHDRPSVDDRFVVLAIIFHLRLLDELLILASARKMNQRYNNYVTFLLLHNVQYHVSVSVGIVDNHVHS